MSILDKVKGLMSARQNIPEEAKKEVFVCAMTIEKNPETGMSTIRFIGPTPGGNPTYDIDAQHQVALNVARERFIEVFEKLSETQPPMETYRQILFVDAYKEGVKKPVTEAFERVAGGAGAPQVNAATEPDKPIYYQ